MATKQPRNVEAFQAREQGLDAAFRSRRQVAEAHVGYLVATGRQEAKAPGWEHDQYLDNTLHSWQEEHALVKASNTAAREDGNFSAPGSSRRGMHPSATAHEEHGRRLLGWRPLSSK
jgi:hypothetical protein